MSRRDSIVKATSAALQPESLDLTQFRQKSVRDSTLRFRAQDVAGALAFKALDRIEDGIKGDALAPLLLRLKYANQHSREAFTRAHMLLLKRHGFLARKPSETMYAVATVALFEWLHDACPKCRNRKQRAGDVKPCLACGQRRVIEDDFGKALAEPYIVGQPTAGCSACHGLGRIFGKAVAARGMVCRACKNSGRKQFEPKQRWALVSDYLSTAAKARGETVKGFRYDDFTSHWHGRYHRFLDVLRRADRAIAEGVDLGLVSTRGDRGEDEEIEEPAA